MTIIEGERDGLCAFVTKGGDLDLLQRRRSVRKRIGIGDLDLVVFMIHLGELEQSLRLMILTGVGLRDLALEIVRMMTDGDSRRLAATLLMATGGDLDL